ncbi:hypothetical protein C7S17_0415 [Burkholderia thailandensis]|nr:hypothetical protein [Burkholderia thailandensis]
MLCRLKPTQIGSPPGGIKGSSAIEIYRLKCDAEDAEKDILIIKNRQI